MTRNIKRESFKDTKKINAFVLISLLALIICDTYSSTLAGAGLEQLELAYTFDFLPYMVIAVFCKVFLFLPKIWSARVEKPKYSNKKKHTTKNHRNHSTSSTLTIETIITSWTYLKSSSIALAYCCRGPAQTNMFLYCCILLWLVVQLWEDIPSIYNHSSLHPERPCCRSSH